VAVTSAARIRTPEKQPKTNKNNKKPTKIDGCLSTNAAINLQLWIENHFYWFEENPDALKQFHSDLVSGVQSPEKVASFSP
jgi:hypothetical protein